MTRPRKSAPTKETPARSPAPPRDYPGGTSAERLTAALIQRRLAHRGVPIGRSLASIRKAVTRARADMAEAGETKLADAIAGALDAAGPLMRSAQLSSAETRHTAVQAARTFVAWVVEHEGIVESPSAVAHLLSAARMAAAESAVHEDALTRGLTGDALESALKRADRCATSRRYDFAQAVALHREARAAKPKTWPWQPAPALPAAPVASNDAEAADDEPSSPEPTSTEDEPPSDEPDDEPEGAQGKVDFALGSGGPEERPRHVEGQGITPPETRIADPGDFDAFGRPLTKPGGPSAHARAEALRKHGLVFDDETGRWVRKESGNG